MKNCARRCPAAVASIVALVLGSASAVHALQVPEKGGRFADLVVHDQTAALDVATTPVGSLPAESGTRAGWDRFKATHGQEWSVYLDRRSGAPLLVEGKGIAWPVEKNATVDSLAASLRAFIGGNRALLLADDTELVLDRDASGELLPDVWQISFDRVFAGVPVSGERFVFTIGHGNLIAFGAPRWSRIDANPFPDLDAVQAQERLSSYMGLTAVDAVELVDKPRLELITLRAAGPSAAGAGVAYAGPYTGSLGAGYTSALVWRVALRVAGDLGTWVALVDAHTGAIRSFVDDNRYSRVKGGVYPVSDDQICPDGCEQPNYPMPFANILIGAATQFTTSAGSFSCTPGGSIASTTLAGKYFRVADACGAVAQSVTCDADLNLGTSGGIDCSVPAGASAGNTHAARSSFYHLNRIAEHARTWLPTNTWLTSRVDDNININSVCNAFWDGSAVNFFKSGGGCRNTGEIAGVFLHEWGHGLDQNDGGGTDNPGEAYADITSLIATHVSCMGRGFFQGGNCSGYGNACLNCTGIRDLDWDKRAEHVPSTPAGFLTAHCPGGTGPCGKEEHCEGYVGAETLWDLAVRDLPAAGLDLASAWQLTDKLWYKSRLGSGGNAYSCALPNSDGCAATSWFTKLRTIDDDDGNLANGTPHAAAIFAAFDRHKIACGTAASQSNQNSSSCPVLGAAALSVTIGNGTATLTWSPVANAASYRILRNDASCSAGSTIVATVTGTSYTDTGLGNGFTEYYTVQTVGTNASCEGLVSNCLAATPQPFAGAVKLGAGSYNCTGQVAVTVTDANIGVGTTTVALASTTETVAETITLTQIAPGSDTYTGSIALTPNAATPNGLLSVGNGDAITATYIDASDGGGGVNIARVANALADCVVPVITKVQAQNITGSAAKITWTTNEPATSVVHHGTVPPPGSTASVAAPVLGHGVDLTGLTECTPYVYSVDSTDVVGNLATDNAGGAYHTFTTGSSTQVSFSSTDTPIPIPDGSPIGATSVITVADQRTVQDVNVTANVQHTYDGDLTLTMTTPAGTTILLSKPRGGSGDNYTNTVFDDEAPIPIGPPPPYTGTFRPDAPLNVADGMNAAGDWKFKVVDGQGQDIGSILSWTLELTYATPSCGPHALARSLARLGDTCASGGPGSANTYWDAGEQVQFKLNLANDGTIDLTGLTATVTSTTPGVVMTDGTASFPDILVGSSEESLAPHFTASLPAGLACGSTVAFQVAIQAAEGSWAGGDFVQRVGRATNGTGRVLDEAFANGIPATWTVQDGGNGGGAAAKWTPLNPGVRTIAAPMLLPVATVDSDAAGPGATQDESLLTPALDLSTATVAILQFDEYFNWFSGGQNEIADVDVRSSLTGGTWVNVLRQQGASSADPEHKSLDISAAAAGAADAQVRFRSWNGGNEQYWQVDNVTIDTSAPGSCDMPVCGLAPAGAKPVADGSFGVAMKGSRGNASGSIVNVTWDVATCASPDHHILFGNLANVASVSVTGASCNLGTTGSASWTGVPAGDLWFVVVGDDNANIEGSWGTDGSGAQRGSGSASGQCGLATRDNSGVCP